MEREGQSTLDSMVNSPSVESKLSMGVIRFIVETNFPLSSLEDYILKPFFGDSCKVTPNTFLNDIKDLSNRYMKGIIKFLIKTKTPISITSNGWLQFGFNFQVINMNFVYRGKINKITLGL